MNSRRRNFRSVVVLPLAGVLAFGAAACGGGKKSYEEGTPAFTGDVPDCSIVPIDLVRKTLKRDDLQGPNQGERSDGVTCTFSAPGSGLADLNSVQLYSNQTEETFEVIPEGFRKNNNKVNKIKGYGDQAYASTVQFYSPTNYFAVRKGKVAVLLTSTSEYDNMKNLMKAILAKL